MKPLGKSLSSEHRSSMAEKGGVLIVGNFLSGSKGSRGVCEDLSERLAKLGWRVTTASASPSKIKRLLDMVATAMKCRDRYQLGLVEVYSGPAFIWAEAVAMTLRRLNKPYILTLHGGNLPAFARKWPRRVGKLLRSAERITAPSRYLLEGLGHLDNRIQIVPNAIDLNRYPYRHRNDPLPKLIWLRSFHSIYNPVMAIQAIARIGGEFPNARLRMVGPDKGDGALQIAKAETHRMGIGSMVEFVGQVPKNMVPEVMAQSDIFLNTTNHDNTPVSVVEAMACGLCVVSTNVGGVPYLIQDLEDGLLVQLGDDRAMAEKVVSILKDPALAGRLSTRARAKASAMGWNEMLPKWESLIRSCLRNMP